MKFGSRVLGDTPRGVKYWRALANDILRSKIGLVVKKLLKFTILYVDSAGNTFFDFEPKKIGTISTQWEKLVPWILELVPQGVIP